MNETENSKKVVADFWSAMHENDFQKAAGFLAEDYLLEWPQSGEKIRGRDNFAAVNSNYPAAGLWRVSVHRIIGDGCRVVSEVSVTDGKIIGRAITFSEVQNGFIKHQVEYWPDSFEAPEWRADWVERS